jgi:hypothetical protein
MPFVKPKVKISVFDKFKPNDTGQEFLGLGGYRTSRQNSRGGNTIGSPISGNDRSDADASLLVAGQFPADEYEVTVDSPAQVRNQSMNSDHMSLRTNRTNIIHRIS